MEISIFSLCGHDYCFELLMSQKAEIAVSVEYKWKVFGVQGTVEALCGEDRQREILQDICIPWSTWVAGQFYTLSIH